MAPYFYININKINEENEKSILKKIANKISNRNHFEKRISVLKSDNSTLIIINNINNTEFFTKLDENNANLSNTILLNNYIDLSFNNSFIQNYQQNYSSILNSTIQDTQSLIKVQKYQGPETESFENKFNSLRSNFYIKLNLYDITLYEGCNNFNCPPKYEINAELSAFLYPNEIITFPITISGFLKTDKLIFDPEIEKINDKKFNYKVGLKFCEENIQIETENGKETKKCSSNIFMCKACMEENKRLNNIKSKYLININGRVSRINKGKYHCFGHFLIGNIIIEDCIAKFNCKACRLLNLYARYFE